VFCYALLIRNRGYIEFETLEKQCWSYVRNIETPINYFLQTKFTHISQKKNLAEQGVFQTLAFSILLYENSKAGIKKRFDNDN
jgi:hypothetical protein